MRYESRELLRVVKDSKALLCFILLPSEAAVRGAVLLKCDSSWRTRSAGSTERSWIAAAGMETRAGCTVTTSCHLALSLVGQNLNCLSSYHCGSTHCPLGHASGQSSSSSGSRGTGQSLTVVRVGTSPWCSSTPPTVPPRRAESSEVSPGHGLDVRSKVLYHEVGGTSWLPRKLVEALSLIYWRMSLHTAGGLG